MASVDKIKIRELVKELRTPPPRKEVTKGRKVAGVVAAIVVVGFCMAVEFYRGVYDMPKAPPAMYQPAGSGQKHTVVEQGRHIFSDGVAREGVKIRNESGGEYWVEKTAFDRMERK